MNGVEEYYVEWRILCCLCCIPGHRLVWISPVTQAPRTIHESATSKLPRRRRNRKILSQDSFFKDRIGARYFVRSWQLLTTPNMTQSDGDQARALSIGHIRPIPFRSPPPPLFSEIYGVKNGPFWPSNWHFWGHIGLNIAKFRPDPVCFFLVPRWPRNPGLEWPPSYFGGSARPWMEMIQILPIIALLLLFFFVILFSVSLHCLRSQLRFLGITNKFASLHFFDRRPPSGTSS